MPNKIKQRRIFQNNRIKVNLIVLVLFMGMVISSISLVSLADFGNMARFNGTKEVHIPLTATSGQENQPRINYSITPLVFTKGKIEISIESNQSLQMVFIWQILREFDGEIKVLNNYESSPYNISRGFQKITMEFLSPSDLLYGEIEIRVLTTMRKSQSEQYKTIESKYLFTSIVFGRILSPIIFVFALLVISIYLIQENKFAKFQQPQGGIINQIIENVKIWGKKRDLHTLFSSKTLENYYKNYPTIKCPDCNIEIIEGSSFCPFCGYHLRKFERY